jgi:lipopolysaccharide transport system ATP-binding protein
VRDREGRTIEAVDIREAVGVEMEFEVIRPNHILAPNMHFYNQEGVYIFATIDNHSNWRNMRRPLGRYRSIAWIPGNFLAEGSVIVGVAVTTLSTHNIHFYERDIVGFQVMDTLDGTSARGDYAGTMPGVVRPLLQWNDDLMTTSETISVTKKEFVK